MYMTQKITMLMVIMMAMAVVVMTMVMIMIMVVIFLGTFSIDNTLNPNKMPTILAYNPKPKLPMWAQAGVTQRTTLEKEK